MQEFLAPLTAVRACILTILRLYSPLETFFDKSSRPSEIELVR
jgi:hypothetical protein